MKFWMLLATASIAALNSGAQEAAETESRQSTIIVTGQKIDTAIEDVTSSVKVVGALEIAREPVSDLYDLVERIPNVNSSFGDLGFSIRGIDQRGVGGAGRGQTLTVYVDDAALGNYTTFFGPLESWDLGQVEVFRGPQSTNFGRNSLAGAIYARSRDPSYQSDLRWRLEGGEYGSFQIAAAGGGALIEDKLAVRVSGQHRKSDGFIKNTFLDKNADATEVTSGRVKFLFEPTSDIRIITTTSYTDNFAGEDGVNPATGFAREAAYDVAGSEGTKTWLQSLNASWQISDRIELQSITAWQQTDYTRIEDYDVTPLPISALFREGVDESISQELRFKYTGERLRGAVGIYYIDASTDYTDSFTIPITFAYPQLPLDNLVSRDSFIDFAAENYAVFFDGEYAITEQVDLLFGARYDNETQTNEAIADTLILGDLPPAYNFLRALEGRTEQVSETEYDAFLPKAGLRWRPGEDTTLAFVVQKAYRAGGSEISALDGSVSVYDPEYLWNYELSARQSFLDGRMTLNSNIYYAEWTDQQVSIQVPNAPNFYTTANAGEATVYGLESELNYQLTEAINLYGGVGYSHTEFKEFPNPNAGAGQPDDFNGNTFAYAPEYSANAGISYDRGQGFFGGLDANYQSSAYSDQENLEINKIGERVLLNARVGYDFANGIRASVMARNLLDKDYYTTLNRDTSGGFARLGDPRVISVRLDASF